MPAISIPLRMASEKKEVTKRVKKLEEYSHFLLFRLMSK